MTSGSPLGKEDSERHISNRSDVLLISTVHSATGLLRGSGHLARMGPSSSGRPTKGDALDTRTLQTRGLRQRGVGAS